MFAAVVLLLGAACIWLPETPATLQIKTETTTEKGVGAATATAKTREERTTTKRTVKTTKTLDGRRDQEADAKPPGEAKRRSETLSGALLAGSLLLLLLAAMGRVPLKLGAGAASFELAPFPQEAVVEFAKKAAEKGVTDDDELKKAAMRMETAVAFDQWRQYLDPTGRTLESRPIFLSHRTSPGDDYWSEVAKSALETSPGDEPADAETDEPPEGDR